jgi:hypothetical protein
VTKEGYVAGARADQSNVTLDGIDINDAQTNAIADINAIPSGGTGQLTAAQSHPVIRLNAEAIEEFRVTTVNANASAGRSSGAQISLVSKSGTERCFWPTVTPARQRMTFLITDPACLVPS